MQEKQTCAKNKKKKKSLIQRHRHTRINTNNPNVSKLKVRISTGQIQVQKNQILVFKLEFTIKKTCFNLIPEFHLLKSINKISQTN